MKPFEDMSPAERHEYAQQTGALMYFDQHPDPERPELFDLFTIRVPHGGKPRPVLRYEAGAVKYRILRFSCMHLLGYVEAAPYGDRYLIKKLRRLLDIVSDEEDAYNESTHNGEN